MDPVTLKRIKLMHPKLRAEVLAAYEYVNQKLLGKGVRLRFTHTYRTPEEQNDLYALGRTVKNVPSVTYKKPLGNIVTWAKAWQSNHNYGLAFDIVILLDKNGDGVFEKAEWNTKSDNDGDGMADWMEVVRYFKNLGWVWGGDWAKFDPPHLEKTFGYTERQLKALIDAGKYTEEVIDGVVYKYPKI